MGRLADKNILITGGNSGIGLAAAQEFDREGARVAICGLNEGSLQAAKEMLGAGSLAVRADVSNLTDLDTMFATIGHLDGVFVNAGYSECESGDWVRTRQRPVRSTGSQQESGHQPLLTNENQATRPRNDSLGTRLLQTDQPLLIGPGVWQCLGKASDGEIRGRSAVDNGRDDARGNEGERRYQPDVSFALAFTLSNLGE
jgi:hypothetical protein